MSFSFGSSTTGFSFGKPQGTQQQQPTQQFGNLGAFGTTQTAAINPTGFGTNVAQPATQEQPSSGGFTFGMPANTNAPSTGFTFGMPKPAVSTAPSIVPSFGNITTPASTAMGSGFSFGTQPQQQAGSMTGAPAASTASLFGQSTGSLFNTPSAVAQVAPQPQAQQQQQQPPSTGFTFGAIQTQPSLATSTTASLWSTAPTTQLTGFGTLTQPRPATTQLASQFGNTVSGAPTATTVADMASGGFSTAAIDAPSTTQSGFSFGTQGGFATRAPSVFPTAATTQSGFPVVTASPFSTGTTQSGFTAAGTTLGGFAAAAAPATTASTLGSFSAGGFSAANTLGGLASGAAITPAQSGIPTGIATPTNAAMPTPTSTATPVSQPSLGASDSTTPLFRGFSFGSTIGTATTQSQPGILSTPPSSLPQTTISSTQATGFSMTGTPAKVAASSLSTTGTTATTAPIVTPAWSSGVTTTSPASTLADTQTQQLTTTTSSVVAPTPAITFRQLEDDINKWTLELDEQEKIFLTQATQVNVWDALLMSNGEKITELNETLRKVKLDQDSLEMEVDFICSQQRELCETLIPLEKQIQSVPNIALQQHADLEREHTYELAENVYAQLQRMMQDLKEVIDQLNANTRSQDANSPINQISKILNDHMDTLQWVDQHTANLQKLVDDVGKLQEKRQQDQDRLQRLGRN